MVPLRLHLEPAPYTAAGGDGRLQQSLFSEVEGRLVPVFISSRHIGGRKEGIVRQSGQSRRHRPQAETGRCLYPQVAEASDSGRLHPAVRLTVVISVIIPQPPVPAGQIHHRQSAAEPSFVPVIPGQDPAALSITGPLHPLRVTLTHHRCISHMPVEQALRILMLPVSLRSAEAGRRSGEAPAQFRVNPVEITLGFAPVAAECQLLLRCNRPHQGFILPLCCRRISCGFCSPP